MASSSALPPTRSPLGHASDTCDVEHDVNLEATMKLIAELALDDITEISNSRKGKGRASAPLSDEEIAFQLQRELLEVDMGELGDFTMARSLNHIIDSDRAFLNALSVAERAEKDDRRAALAVSEGNALPPLSNAQQLLLEDPTFSVLVGRYVPEFIVQFPDLPITVTEKQRQKISLIVLAYQTQWKRSKTYRWQMRTFTTYLLP
ncbi:hypothetical protein DXG03_002372 [Asterophora parasitica]|uniref:Uncharacterized protein n=1 Tax=Asterophora parasitica TaxID=117018 RepID=A0A9P7KB85_9AGAR|nr:hypothetical protein DXG03_002372 [Asterophora parasitica]